MRNVNTYFFLHRFSKVHISPFPSKSESVVESAGPFFVLLCSRVISNQRIHRGPVLKLIKRNSSYILGVLMLHHTKEINQRDSVKILSFDNGLSTSYSRERKPARGLYRIFVARNKFSRFRCRPILKPFRRYSEFDFRRIATRRDARRETRRCIVNYSMKVKIRLLLRASLQKY